MYLPVLRTIASLYFPKTETISPGDVNKNNCFRGEHKLSIVLIVRKLIFFYYEENFIVID